MRRQATDWEMLFAKRTTNEELVSRIQRNSCHSVIKIAKYLNERYTKEYTRMSREHRRKCSMHHH